MARKNMTDRIPKVQEIVDDGKLEKSLRGISGDDVDVSFSMTLGASQTTYSYSSRAADGTSENYSKTVPYVAETPSPLPPGETA